MPRNYFLRAEMKYFFLISSLLATSCRYVGSAIFDPTAADSIPVYCERVVSGPFGAVSAEEFAGRHHRLAPPVVIREPATVRKLVARADSLRVASALESRPYMDTRMMLILHRKHRPDDSLFIGVFPQYHMQLNRQIMEPDSVLWTEVRDAVAARDSLFAANFGGRPCYSLTRPQFEILRME